MNKNITLLTRYLFVALLILQIPDSGFAQTSARSSTDIPAPRLQNELERIAKLAKGKVGVSAVHLETGRRISLDPKGAYPMASTVKVAIAVQLFTKIEKGELSLMTMVDLQPADLHPGSGTLDVLFNKPGVMLSVQNLLELMMVISDNSATDILLRLVGGPKAVAERVKALNIQGMSVDRTIIELLADLEGVTLPSQDQWTLGFYDKLLKNRAPDAVKIASAKLETDPRDTSTPEAMVDLLTQIYNAKAIKSESRDLLLAVMERCRGGLARLKGYLPAGTIVAHKTGSLDANATDDVGIITLPDGAGHIAIAVFVGKSEQPLAEREQTIAHLTRAIYDYFLFSPVSAASSGR